MHRSGIYRLQALDKLNGQRMLLLVIVLLSGIHAAMAQSKSTIVNDAVKTARGLLDSSNPYDQILGAGTLSDIGDKDALAFLEGHATGSDIVFQRSAIDTLIGIQHPNGIDLIYRLASQSSSFTRFLTQSLATNPRDDMGEFLLGVLRASKPDVQRYAIQALAHMEVSAAAVDVIKDVVNSPDSEPTTKAYGYYYLAQRGHGAEVEGPLLDLIATGDLTQREVVAVALAHLSSPLALEGLEKLERSRDARVALAALSSHAALGDANAVNELENVIVTGTSLNAEVGASAIRRLPPKVAHELSVGLFERGLRPDPGGRLLEAWRAIEHDASDIYAWGLEHRSEDVRLQTLWLIGERQEHHMLAKLGEYLTDESPAIRGMAAWAIVHIAPEEYAPGTKV